MDGCTSIKFYLALDLYTALSKPEGFPRCLIIPAKPSVPQKLTIYLKSKMKPKNPQKWNWAFLSAVELKHTRVENRPFRFMQEEWQYSALQPHCNFTPAYTILHFMCQLGSDASSCFDRSREMTWDSQFVYFLIKSAFRAISPEIPKIFRVILLYPHNNLMKYWLRVGVSGPRSFQEL